MSLSGKDFDALPPQDYPDELPYQVMELLRRADVAYSATELARVLVGIPAGGPPHYSARVAELLPVLRFTLNRLCEQREIEARSKDGLAGSETYYRRTG